MCDTCIHELIQKNGELEAKLEGMVPREQLEEAQAISRRNFGDAQARRRFNANLREVNRRLGDQLSGQGKKVREMQRELREALDQVRGLTQSLVAGETGWVPPRECPPQLATVLGMVVAEYHRAKAKHGEKVIDGSFWTNDHQRFAILAEEVGEAAKELNDEALSPGIRSLPEGGTVEGGHMSRLLDEVVQSATMAAAWATKLLPGSPLTKCWICGDPFDHSGVSHGIATGDGRTRADAAAERAAEPTEGQQGQEAAEGVLGSVQRAAEPVTFLSTPRPKMQAVTEGIVRVPDGWVALVLPQERYDVAVQAVMKAEGEEERKIKRTRTTDTCIDCGRDLGIAMHTMLCPQNTAGTTE